MAAGPTVTRQNKKKEREEAKKGTFSTHRVSMTMARVPDSHVMRQKSSRVECNGPWVTMNSRGELKPGT